MKLSDRSIPAVNSSMVVDRAKCAFHDALREGDFPAALDALIRLDALGVSREIIEGMFNHLLLASKE